MKSKMKINNNNNNKKKKSMSNFSLFLILTSSNSSSICKPIWDLSVKYFQIWPIFQWITSLLTLIIIYWVSGYFYNKFLSDNGGWMDAKTRILMIIIDLILNFSIGIYYMNYRDTFIGTLMLKCPVFCSPIFWLFELICFYVYYRYVTKSIKKKTKKY